jgi:hypothetical protein
LSLAILRVITFFFGLLLKIPAIADPTPLKNPPFFFVDYYIGIERLTYAKLCVGEADLVPPGACIESYGYCCY